MTEPTAGPTAPVRPPRHRALPAWAGPATRLVHGGALRDLNAGAVVPPIYQTSTFHFPAAFSEARPEDVYLYSRNANPTVDNVEEVLRELEGGESARLFASGMGAIASTAISLLRPGAELVVLADLYGGTTELWRGFLRPYGIKVRELTDEQARTPERVVSRETRLILLETPTNPCLRVHDIARWARAADEVGAILAVDSTFAPPLNQNPLSLGADLVLHSATKYLGGHTDLLAGVVVGPERLLRRIDPKRVLGAPLDPFAAFLLHRSLKTLALRVERQNENGRAVASALASHPAVRRVYYPGRAGEEEEAIAARQMRGRGGVLSLSLAGGAEAVERFLQGLSIVQVASSLGGVESLVSVPVQTSHRHLGPEALAARGIDAGLVRIALGIEETEDLVRDLRAALDRASSSAPPAL